MKNGSEELSDNEVMVIVIDYLISQSHNHKFIKELKNIRDGIAGKKHIEERLSPSFRSIEVFGINMFTFSMSEYRKVAFEIKRNLK